MPKNTLPDWEQVLSAAARLQQLLPEAVLVGGTASAWHAKHRLSRDEDHVYPQPNGESALQQLQIQLANPLPFDLEETKLAEYKNLAPRWQDWNAVKRICTHCATMLLDRIAGPESE